MVGLPHFWHFNVTPAAAQSTTNEAEQFEQAKMMSLLGFWAESVEPAVCCIEQSLKQETYRAKRECPGGRDEAKASVAERNGPANSLPVGELNM